MSEFMKDLLTLFMGSAIQIFNVGIGVVVGMYVGIHFFEDKDDVE